MNAISALYQRVSDGTDRSVEQQNADNEAAARGFGWETVSFSDPVSASRFSKKERPEWDALTAAVAAGRFSYVVLWESSRGDRKLATWAAFLDACRDTGTGIYVTSDDRLYDLRSYKDWKALAEDGIDSVIESEKTSLRVRRDVAQVAERGEPYGRIPYGYRRTYTREPGRKRPLPHQEPDPGEAPVAAEIIGRIARGDSISGIVRDFDRRGVRTRAGGKWSHSSIARLVTQGVVYIGLRRHNGGPLLPGKWPAIVAPDTYWRAVRVLADPARRVQAGQRGGIRPGKAKWLLSYIATCGACGGPLSVKAMVRVSGDVPMYRCLRGCVSAPVKWIDEMATVGVVGFCAQSPLYEILTRGDDREASAARDEAAAARSRLADLEDQAVSGAISAGSFARMAARLEADIAELEARAEAASVPPALRDLVTGASAEPEARWNDIHRRWKAMPLAARRDVIRTFFAPVLDAIPRGGNPLDRDRFRMPPSRMLRGVDTGI